jgi:hypothetical protein
VWLKVSSWHHPALQTVANGFFGITILLKRFLDADDFLYVGFGAFAGLVMAL